MKSAIRYILIVLISLLTLFLCYEFFGFLVLALQTPQIYSNGQTYTFMGMFIMAATYLLFLILSITALVIFVIKTKQKNK